MKEYRIIIVINEQTKETANRYIMGLNIMEAHNRAKWLFSERVLATTIIYK